MKNSEDSRIGKEGNIAREITLGFLVSTPLIKNDILNSKYLLGKVLSVGKILNLRIFSRALNVIVLEISPKIDEVRVNKTTKIKIIEKFNKQLFILEEPELSIEFLCNKLIEIKEKDLRVEILKVIKKKIPQEKISSLNFFVGKNYLSKLPELNEIFSTLESPIIKKILASLKNERPNINNSLILLLREIIITNPNLLESLSSQYNDYLESIELLVEQDIIQQSLEYNGKNYDVRRGNLILKGLGIIDLNDVEGISSLIGIKYIDLSENKIEEINGLERFHSLKKLDLFHNQITKIRGLENQTKLLYLNLSRNKITNIEGLHNLKNLTDLNLSNNQISEVSGLESLTNLIHLTMYDNKIHDIKAISYLVNLEEFYVAGNNINDIEGLENLGKLKKTSFKNNPLPKMFFEKLGESGNNGQNWVNYAKLRAEGKVPQVIFKNKCFDILDGVLDLKNLGINNIAELNLNKFRNLVEIDLSLNQITDINGLESLTKLEKLNLKDNPIPDYLINHLGGIDGKGYVKIPRKFVDFCRSKKEGILEYIVFNKKKYYVLGGVLSLINLGIKDIREIEGIETLKGLKNLNLSNNKISEINGIESLTSLIKFDLHGNYIMEIKNLDRLQNLEKLYLYDNRISEINGINDLKNIKKLDLSFNSIAEIKGLENLSKLEHLELSKNQISRLFGLKKLKNLKILIIKDNLLSDINEIEDLPNLETLWLSRNYINDIEVLKKLPKLKELFLNGNPFTSIESIKHLKELVVLRIDDTEIPDISALKDLLNLIDLNITNTKIPWEEKKKIENSNNLQDYFNPEKRPQDKEFSEDNMKLKAEYNDYLDKLTPPQREIIRRYEELNIDRGYDFDNFLWEEIISPEDRNKRDKREENFGLLIRCPKLNFIQNYIKRLLREPKNYEELAYDIFKREYYAPISSLKKDIIEFFEKGDLKILKTIIYYEFLTNLTTNDIIEMINHPTLNFLDKIARAIEYYYWEEVEWFFNKLEVDPAFRFKLAKKLMQREESIVKLLFSYGEFSKLNNFKLIEIIQNPKYYFFTNFMNFAKNDEESGWYFFDGLEKNKTAKNALKEFIIKTINSQRTIESDLVIIRDNYMMNYFTDEEMIDLIKNPAIKVVRYLLKMIGIEQYLGESEANYELGKRVKSIVENHKDIREIVEDELHESLLDGNYQELKEIIQFDLYEYIDDLLLKDAIENPKSAFMKIFINLILKGDYVWESERSIDRFIERIYNLSFIERIQNSKNNIIQYTKEVNKDFKNKLYNMVEWGNKELKEIAHEFLKVISEPGDIIYVTYDNVKFFVKERQLTISRRQDINDMSKFQGFEKLTSLEKLSLNNCPFKEIKGLEPLKNLKSLDISRSEITSTKGLEGLTSLKEIKLTNNKIHEIIGLDSIKNLISLDLSYNQIVDIQGLKSLTQLKLLHFSSNKIYDIKGLENLLHLEKLYLNHNKIIEIKNLKSLKNLKHLQLSSNKISIITGLRHLENLETLNLSGNIIEKITGLDKVENLKNLMLSSNKIKEINNLEFLINLEQLNLSSNQVQEIQALDKLSNLDRLDLTDNKISQIKGLDSLKNLKRLTLRQNKIGEISGLDKIIDLESLDLSHNDITELKGFGHFRNIHSIRLYKNPIDEKPRFKYMMPKEYVEYCRKNRS